MVVTVRTVEQERSLVLTAAPSLNRDRLYAAHASTSDSTPITGLHDPILPGALLAARPVSL